MLIYANRKGIQNNAAVNEFPDTPHRGAMWGICYLGVPKTQKSPQPGAHFMSKPPDNPQVKPPPNRVGYISCFVFINDYTNKNHYVTTDLPHCVTFKLVF